MCGWVLQWRGGCVVVEGCRRSVFVVGAGICVWMKVHVARQRACDREDMSL